MSSFILVERVPGLETFLQGDAVFAIPIATAWISPPTGPVKVGQASLLDPQELLPRI